MAATRSYVCPVIFLHENGEPIKFFLHRSTKDKLLIKLIERGGGCIITEVIDSDRVIKLADPSQGQVKGFVSTKFIMDSNKQQVAQDVNKYRLDRRFQAHFTHVVHYKDEETKESSQLSFRRKKYSLRDDMKIVKYVKSHATDDMPVGGNVLWKRMEGEQVTGHSWQSMQKHYKVFLQNKMDQPVENLQASLTWSRIAKPQAKSTPSKTKNTPPAAKHKSAATSTSPPRNSKVSESSSSSSSDDEPKSSRKGVSSPAKRTRSTTSQGRKRNRESDSTDGVIRRSKTSSKKKCRQFDSDSSVDDFDEHLMEMAEKSATNVSHSDGNDDDDHDDDDEETDSHEHETSAKDTQDEDDIPSRQNLKSKYPPRTALANRQAASASPSRSKYPPKSSRANRQAAAASPSKAKHKTNSSEEKSTKDKPSASLNTCTRQLFDKDTSSNVKDSPAKPIAEVKTKLWQMVDSQFEKFIKVMELPCTQALSRPQILHALYVVSGSVDEVKHYIETGKLSNGESPWEVQEDEIIQSNDIEGKKRVIKKRGYSNVIERKRFLTFI